MRSEQDMFDLIVNAAREDGRIRAVYYEPLPDEPKCAARYLSGL